ncbi:MAG TPA: U32 family peptidase [Firmicutes bacterium]|nr:U32 family peptidase [Bacillota bacterium]
MKLPELLVPAGNLEKLRTAVLYGADAVYTGYEGLSLRTSQAEFGLADLATGVKEAHAKGVKVYTALNVFARNSQLKAVSEAVRNLSEIGIDGIILSDPGVFQMVRAVNDRLPVHLSTQANTTNVEAVRFWRQQGVQRIVLARELNLKEVAEITQAVPEMEFELFVHGAMCMAYSGRCFLSAALTGRSANQGECTHPCRWEYLLVEKSRPEHPLCLETDLNGSVPYSYILSSKDLCMIKYLPEVLAAGISSLKIEGRMKSVYYVAAVTRTYRWALNAAIKGQNYSVPVDWWAELGKISNRGYTTGFYLAEDQVVTETNPDFGYEQTYGLAGTVLKYDPTEERLLLGARNLVTADDRLELLLPETTLLLDSSKMTDEGGSPITKAHNGYRVYLPLTIEREAKGLAKIDGGRNQQGFPGDIPEGAVVRKFLGQAPA